MSIINISKIQPRYTNTVTPVVERKQSGNIVPYFTLSTGVIYIALASLVLLLAPEKFANADSSDNDNRYLQAVDITVVRPVRKEEITRLSFLIHYANLLTREHQHNCVSNPEYAAPSVTYLKNSQNELSAVQPGEEWVHLDIFVTEGQANRGKRI